MVRYSISQHSDGNMLVAVDDQLFVEGKRNREKYLTDQHIQQAIVCRPIHGTNIRTVTPTDAGQIFLDCDGFITTAPGVAIGATVADCLPVWFWDETQQVVGIVHAGWRGAQAGIVPLMAQKLQQEFGCLPENISAAIGPCIQQCHFAVRQDVLDQFLTYPQFVAARDNQTFLDLPGIVREQLLQEGISPTNLTTSDECTTCLTEKYFSYRRDKPNPIEVMLAYIMRC